MLLQVRGARGADQEAGGSDEACAAAHARGDGATAQRSKAEGDDADQHDVQGRRHVVRRHVAQQRRRQCDSRGRTERGESEPARRRCHGCNERGANADHTDQRGRGNRAVRRPCRPVQHDREPVARAADRCRREQRADGGEVANVFTADEACPGGEVGKTPHRIPDEIRQQGQQPDSAGDEHRARGNVHRARPRRAAQKPIQTRPALAGCACSASTKDKATPISSAGVAGAGSVRRTTRRSQHAGRREQIAEWQQPLERAPARHQQQARQQHACTAVAVHLPYAPDTPAGTAGRR